MAKILCIEDEPDIQADIVEELVEAGHQVMTAGNGEDGLAATIERRPDLILCDNLMPCMTGLEFFARLRADHPELNSTPFVILSAHADSTHVAEGLDLGADAYLTKPIDFAKLMETIETLLARRQPVGAKTRS